VKVPLVDLSAHPPALARALEQAFARVVSNGRFILGPEVEAFEAEIARFVGTGHAIGVSSGSDALVCALAALGIGAGDEVVTTAFTFFATAGAVLRLGAVPKLVDVRAGTLNMDPERLEAAIGPRVRALVPVHLFGQPAEMDAIAEIAERRGVPIVEDAAQALGAAYAGRQAGAWGKLGCFSFYPSKPLGALGDGGMIVTSDAELAERCRALRVHGAVRKNEHVMAGFNFRLDALQAALLRAKLPYLEGWLAERREHAALYARAFNGIRGLEVLAMHPKATSSFAHFTLRVADEKRNALAARLGARGVETAVYYPLPLHLQPALVSLGYGAGALPESERAAREVLSIPLSPGLGVAQRDHVIATICEFFA
jgi:dTDP-4-amino-4,6-dideoxygalactose transaminase